MSYTVKFTDFNNKGALIVNDSTTNTETSLGFSGRNVRGYGATVAENFLHLLENFANNTAPLNPIEGQLWYDTTEGVEDLKIYDGTIWKSAGSIRKSSAAPQGVIGDLWVDTDNQQLFLYNGASWVLVGPTFSSGLKSGIQAEVVIDSNNNEQVVLKVYVEDEIVAIYSIKDFVPKSTIGGFSTIKPGLNISSKTFSNTTITNRLWGTAEKAEALLIGTNTVAASNFLRKDISNITNFGFTVRNNNGIAVGGEAQLRLAVDSSQIANLYHSTPGSAIDFRINKEGNITTLVRIDSTGNIGIGVDNFAPEETLDVDGTAVISGDVRITSTNNTVNSATGALRVAGGVNIEKDLIVNNNAKFVGHITVGDNEIDNVAVFPAQTDTFNIGSPTNKFATIHASTVYSNLVGNVLGNITGNVNGTAVKLLASTNFEMTGDVSTSTPLSFDGQTGGFTKTFNTEISPAFIENKEELTSVSNNDYLLVWRSTSTGLKKISRPTFFSKVPMVPVGAIFPYAGTVVPEGYLLCDGSEKQRTRYPDLFNVLGFTYGDPSSLLGLGTFKLPDLRGRFPLGRDNMDNGDSVPNASDGGATNIDAGGGPANRVTDATADILGNSNGIEQKTLDVENLPNHTHNLTGDSGTQYYVTNNNAGIPPDTGSLLGNGPTAAGQGQYYPKTGDMITNTSYSVPINIMNPYLTINYIIYAGEVVT
jgi:microcystin-dependent protein